MRSYQQPGLTLRQDAANDPRLVHDLQRDLRALGYLRSGIDGAFGPGTAAAVAALCWDLQHNDGTGRDGTAPVRLVDYNRGRAGSVGTVVDAGLAACIDELMSDARVPKVPSAADPAAENRRALAAVLAAPGEVAPAEFMLAMFMQESGAQHYRVPAPGNDDNFVVVGLDRNAGDTVPITSRGYGLGQYTLFHHPPRPEEVTGFILDPVANVARAFAEYREKFDRFITGPAANADDRLREKGAGPLRMCKYQKGDPAYMRNCRACALDAGPVAIHAGDPLYPGAPGQYEATQYYASAEYRNVPNRAAFPCDWPYASRRYNGSGVNSYHYQARILLNLAKLPPPASV